MGNIEAFRGKPLQTVPQTTSWPLSLRELEANLIAPWSRTPTIQRALTEAERSWISHRLSEVVLFADAQPDNATAMVEIGGMLLGLQTGGITAEQAQAKAAMFAEAVEDIPTWAIVAARKAWNRGDRQHYGEDAKFAFAPMPGQLASAARAFHAEARGEALRLRRLLSAGVDEPKPANPEMLRRIGGLLASMPKAGDE
jgi:hypothetical protein